MSIRARIICKSYKYANLTKNIICKHLYLPSVSTSAISFAIALTIRMPVSLIPLGSASSCRRCVFFSGGVSKRNWSTDILYKPTGGIAMKRQSRDGEIILNSQYGLFG